MRRAHPLLLVLLLSAGACGPGGVAGKLSPAVRIEAPPAGEVSDGLDFGGLLGDDPGAGGDLDLGKILSELE
jgi:hypothetical protein